MLANCSECGKLFAALRPELCPECRQQEEAEFKLVRTYLRDHPSSGVADVAEATGVSEKRILHFVRTGRLRLQGRGGILTCRFCGVPVESGEICPACAQRMRRRLVEPGPATPPAASSTSSTRVYIADRRQDRTGR